MGNLKEGSSIWDFERRMKGTPVMGLLSLKRLREGCLGGEELLHWGPWKICSDSLRIWTSLSIGAPRVPRGPWCLGGRLLYRGLSKMDEGKLPSWGTLRYVKQGSEMVVYFHRGPTFGNMDGRFFLGDSY